MNLTLRLLSPPERAPLPIKKWAGWLPDVVCTVQPVACRCTNYAVRTPHSGVTRTLITDAVCSEMLWRRWNKQLTTMWR
jgi:hypothetical protein